MTEPRDTLELTWERFRELKHGAVLQTGAGSLRLVLMGPGDANWKIPRKPTSKAYVQLPIRNRSWTGRAYTLINCYDLTNGPYAKPNPTRIVPVRSARALCGVERELLRSMGFDWIAQYRRELAEAAGRWYIPPGVREWMDRFVTRFEKTGKR